MERRASDKGPIIMTCVLTLAVGVIYFFTSAATFFGALIAGGIAQSQYSMLGMVAVLMSIAAIQIVAGIFGILSFKRERLRPTLRWFGYAMLLMSVTYVVTTALMRGFQWGTLFNVAVSVMYLTIVRPT